MGELQVSSLLWSLGGFGLVCIIIAALARWSESRNKYQEISLKEYTSLVIDFNDHRWLRKVDEEYSTVHIKAYIFQCWIDRVPTWSCRNKLSKLLL